jgi:hypothetical protein
MLAFSFLALKGPIGNNVRAFGHKYCSVVDPHWFQCGCGSSFLFQCGSVSSFYVHAVPDPDPNSQTNADPSGSGSCSYLKGTKILIFS